MRRNVNSFLYVTGNTLTTRPAAAFGTSVSGAQNSYSGGYTQVLAGGSVLYDCYLVDVQINSIGNNAAARGAMVTIGMDPAGGSSYQDWIPDLLCGQAAQFVGSGCLGGYRYRFPLFVPAGASIAAKLSGNFASPAGRISITLWGRPTRPDLLMWGTSVEAIGISAGSSAGTSVTSGSTSEGSWTSLGTSARRCIAWQLGCSVHNSATSSNIHYAADLSYGDGTNQIVIIDGAEWQFNSGTELCGLAQPGPVFFDVPAGATLYGRLQADQSPNSGLSMAAYGVRI